MAWWKALRFQFQFSKTSTRWTFTFSTNTTDRFLWTAPEYDPDFFTKGDGSAASQVTLEFIPAAVTPVDAIFDFDTPTLPYEDWLPMGSTNRDARADSDGNVFYVTVKVTRPSGDPSTEPLPKAKFRFRLAEVSKRPGVCMNYPPSDPGASVPDLAFKYSDDLWIYPTLPDGSQEAETRSAGLSATVAVVSRDFAAFGRVSVLVTPEGGEPFLAHIEGHKDLTDFTLPQDLNSNQIADAWERQHSLYGAIADVRWDFASVPDHRCNGDGISYFEKYRGFRFHGLYERLNPKTKYLFIYDEQGSVRKYERLRDGPSLAAASGSQVRFISDQEWTGPGAAANGKRVVNFNGEPETHATDQHAVHVRMDSRPDPRTPEEYLKVLYEKDPKAAEKYKDEIWATFGTSWPDDSATASDSPVGSVLCTINPKNISSYARETVRYHTMGLETEFPDFEEKWPVFPLLEYLEKSSRGSYLANAYITNHPDDWMRRNRLFAQSTIIHEIGHIIGIDDLKKEGHSIHPASCVMRYICKGEFGRNPWDRLELQARSVERIWPSIYCLSADGTAKGIACRRQVKVTDGPIGTGGRTLLPPPISPPPRLQATVLDSAPRSAELPGAGQVAALELSTSLHWEDVLEGDPLRVRLNVICARYREAELSALMAGSTNDVTLPLPILSTNWASTVTLVLSRIPDWWSVPPYPPGTPVLVSNAWDDLLLPGESDLNSDFGMPITEYSREWLTTPENLVLTPGVYALKAAWNGQGMVDSAFLPPSGLLETPEFYFIVGAITNDSQRAAHYERLAISEYLKGGYSQSKERALAALQYGPSSTDALALRSIAANAAIKINHYREAALILSSDSSLHRDTEPAQAARAFLDALLPELSIVRAGDAIRLTIQALPNQTYSTYASSDLSTWMPIDSRHTPTNSFEIEDFPVLSSAKRFYRVVWEE